MKKLTFIGIILSLLVGLALWQQQHIVAAKAAPMFVTQTVTTTADSGPGSLRQAIADAASGDTIDFSLSGCPCTIALTGELLINKSLTIDGPGANQLTVSGNNASRVFFISSSTVTLDGLTVTGGNGASTFGSGQGGGIHSFFSTLTVSNSSVSGNTSVFGGGIFTTGGTVTVTNSTVSGNSIGNNGGGIYNSGMLTLTNSTVSGNSAGSFGGGIYNTGGATLKLTNSTVSGNRAGAVGGGGIVAGGTETLNNTIVAGNFLGPGTTAADIGLGTIDTANNNLIGDVATSGGITNGVNGNIVGNSGAGTIDINTVLNTTLASNGGPTKTHALVPSSPALNAGSNALAAGLTTDQRGSGFPRIANATVDIGAFEGAALIVTKTADTNDGTCDADCSLREAIAAASPGDTILFSSFFNSPRIIPLALGELVINKDLKILGTGASQLTVSGNNASRVFSISSSTVLIDGLTVSGGNGTGATSLSGGGIFNNGGALTITNSTVSGNSASGTSGGIYTSGTLTLTNSTVSGNSSPSTGGIFNNGGALTITNSTVSGNSTTSNGGGIVTSFGTLTVSNSTVSGNSAGNIGGGIFNALGTLTLTNSTVSGNRANSDGDVQGAGGGISAFGTETLNNTIVAGNFVGTGSTPDDISGDTINTANNNLIGDATSSGGITDGMNGNKVGNGGAGTIDINTVLDTTLANNGGPTLTHRLKSNSPAIDAGSNALALDASSNALTTDQRGTGFPRISGCGSNPVVDIGAFEVQPCYPDLTITKTHSGNFSQGQTGAQYTITVTNSGGTATNGTTVTDTVPAGLTATAISGTGWTCTQPGGPCTRSDALAGSTSYPIITLTVDVANNAPASVTNSATVSGGGETNTGNDTANDLTTINTGTDLTITKTHVGSFSQGQTGAQYTITVTNSGGTATNGTTVTVSDTVPTGLTATAISGTGWTCTQPAGPCTRSDVLAASASYPVITLTVDVANNAPSSVTNTATVSGGDDTNTGNNTANDPTTIAAGPDLTITKTHVGNFSQGQTGAQYTITVTNSGGTATNGTTVTVSDTAPAGLTATAISGTGWTCTQPSGPCTRTDVLAASGSYPIITLTVDVANNAPTSVINTATVSGGGEVVTGNDTANDPTTIGAGPDLTITKTHVGNFSQGQTGAQYTITVTNSGGTPTNGTTVTVSDTVPSGLTATAISGAGWTCTQPGGPCTRTDVLAASGSYPVITLTVDVANNAPSSVINTATVSGGGEVVTGNDTANDSTTIGPGPDLTITKTHVGNFSQGQTGAQYTVTVTNSGSTPTSGTVTVTDTVPSGLTATAISGAGWSCTQPSGPCTRSDALAASASYPVLTLTVNVASNAPASVTNTATVSGGNETNTGNDTANDLTTINPVAGPDLTITKSHSGNFSQGQAGAQYTITVTNSGGTATSGTVTVTDTVPSGLTATAISGAGWSCTQPSGPCTRSNALNPSSSYPVLTLTVNVASNAPASVTNTATVSGGGETNTGNDTANDLTTINPSSQTKADLDISKSDVSDPVFFGDNITYKIEVENNGPGKATGVIVTDTLPGNVNFVSASSGCSYNSGTVTCTIGSLAKDKKVTWTIVVHPNATGTYSNTATVTANEPDPKLSNNSDQETTKVVAATVGVASVSLNPSTVKGGNNVTGTVTLTAPAPSNTVVTLSSNNESVAKPTVSSITINANQTSKTFTVKTFSVSSTKTAKIKATANSASKEATLTVTH